MNPTLLPPFIPAALWISALAFAALTVFSVVKYRREHQNIKELVERCILCDAEVINPVVLDWGNLYASSPLLAGFQNVGNLPVEYVCTEVVFDVNGERIQTTVLRLATTKHPKSGDALTIYFDPHNPKQAFAKDMKRILLHKPLRDCILYAAAAIVSLLCAVFLLLA
ncbi:MAG: hypothetical protein E7501_03745 [Ruminococcus sp.]|nr:hypothetical protein [Ruminococcus sp.]